MKLENGKLLLGDEDFPLAISLYYAKENDWKQLLLTARQDTYIAEDDNITAELNIGAQFEKQTPYVPYPSIQLARPDTLDFCSV